MLNLLRTRWTAFCRAGVEGVGAGGIQVGYQHAQTAAAAVQKVVAKTGPDQAVNKDDVQSKEAAQAVADLVRDESQIFGEASPQVKQAQAILDKVQNGGKLTQDDVKTLQGAAKELSQKLVTLVEGDQKMKTALAALPPELRTAVATSPHPEQALETFQKLKAMHQPYVDKQITALVTAVATPRDGIGTPLMTEAQALKAAQAMIDMKPQETGAVSTLLDGAKSDTERALILKAVASEGYKIPGPPTPGKDEERNALALAHVKDFANGIRGLKPDDLLAKTTLLHQAQTFENSCAPTTGQKTRAEADPIYAFGMNTHPDKIEAEQRALLETGSSGVAITRATVAAYREVNTAEKLLGSTEQKKFQKDVDARIGALVAQHPIVGDFRQYNDAIETRIGELQKAKPRDQKAISAMYTLQTYIQGVSGIKPEQLEAAQKLLPKLPLDQAAMSKMHDLWQTGDGKTIQALDNIKRFAAGDPKLFVDGVQLQQDLEQAYGKAGAPARLPMVIEARLVNTKGDDPIDADKALKDLSDSEVKPTPEQAAAIKQFVTGVNAGTAEIKEKCLKPDPTTKISNMDALNSYMTNPDFPPAGSPDAAALKTQVKNYVEYLHGKGEDISMDKVEAARKEVQTERGVLNTRYIKDRDDLVPVFKEYTGALGEAAKTAKPGDKANVEVVKRYLEDPTFKPTPAQLKQLEAGVQYMQGPPANSKVDLATVKKIQGKESAAFDYNSAMGVAAELEKTKVPHDAAQNIAVRTAGVPDNKLAGMFAKMGVAAASIPSLVQTLTKARQAARTAAAAEVKDKGPAALTDKQIDIVARMNASEALKQGGTGMSDKEVNVMLHDLTGRNYKRTDIDVVNFKSPKAKEYYDTGSIPPAERAFFAQNTTFGPIKDGDPTLASADAALRQGNAVPFGIQYTDKDGHPAMGGHEMLLCDSLGAAPNRQYCVADPYSGKTAWVAEADLKNGAFASDPKYGFNLTPPPGAGRVTSMHIPE